MDYMFDGEGEKAWDSILLLPGPFDTHDPCDTLYRNGVVGTRD